MLVYLYLDTQEFSTEQIPILFELFDFQKSLSVYVWSVRRLKVEKKQQKCFYKKRDKICPLHLRGEFLLMWRLVMQISFEAKVT